MISLTNVRDCFYQLSPNIYDYVNKNHIPTAFYKHHSFLPAIKSCSIFNSISHFSIDYSRNFRKKNCTLKNYESRSSFSGSSLLPGNFAWLVFENLSAEPKLACFPRTRNERGILLSCDSEHCLVNDRQL